MKKTIIHSCIWTTVALLLSILPSHAQVYMPGNVSIEGDLGIVGAGKAIVFFDGSRQDTAAMRYARTIIVSPGDTPEEGGQNLLNAIESASKARPGANYLVKIEPGIYTVGKEAVKMIPYADIEGSGEASTIIRGSPSSSNAGVVMGADNAELRFLTVETTGSGIDFIGVHNTGVSPTLLHAAVSASGGSATNIAIKNGRNAKPRLEHVAALADGTRDEKSLNYGIFNDSANAAMTNVSAIAQGGRECVGIYNFKPGGLVEMRDVSASASGGSLSNHGIFNYDAETDMQRVAATGEGGTDSFGIRNDASSSVMMDVSATALGGTSGNYGVYNLDSTIEMERARVTAEGGASSIGMYNEDSSSKLRDIFASAAAATDNTGFQHLASAASMAKLDVNGMVAEAAGGNKSQAIKNSAEATTSVFQGVNASATGAAVSTTGLENVFSVEMYHSRLFAEGGIGSAAITNRDSEKMVMENVVASGGNFGLFNLSTTQTGLSVYADHCSFKGGTPSIRNSSSGEYDIYCGSCKLDGPVATFTNTETCVNSYDGGYNPLDSFCM